MGAINSASIEILVAADQVNLNPVRAGRLDNVRGSSLAAQVDLELVVGGTDNIIAFAYGPIERHDDADVVAKFLQFEGQNTDLVAQVTGRTERENSLVAIKIFMQ